MWYSANSAAVSEAVRAIRSSSRARDSRSPKRTPAAIANSNWIPGSERSGTTATFTGSARAAKYPAIGPQRIAASSSPARSSFSMIFPG
jgi:hypothetical protein